MCSLAGFNWKDEALILKMNERMRHRGPDGTGVFVDDAVSLGHNRLSILDVRTVAGQPMKSGSGRFVTVFNGEIYNFRELRAELADYRFTTESDTEVLLAAYDKWGGAMVQKLNGIFAFAIYDTKTQDLFLARDRAGMKPLYYYNEQGKFIFASEIKALLEHPIPRVLDREAFSIYLRTLYVPAPRTMFQGIQKFPAGHFGTVKKGILTFTRFDEEKAPVAPHTFGEAVTAFQAGFEKAVEGQLISDRPLGIYLSGGLDSSAVLHMAAKKRKHIDTFSVGYEIADKKEEAKFNRDFLLARDTAKHYGTRHHEVFFRENDVLGYLEKAIVALDEPISNPTILPQMLLAEFTKKEGVDVVLGGDGGDELFGGYERYRLSRIATLFQKLPAFFRRPLMVIDSLRKLNTPAGVKRFALFLFQKDAILSRVLQGGVFDANAAERFFEREYFSEENSGAFEQRFMDTDRRTWLVDESLMRTDKMSMASAVEARAPFLDNEMLSFASSLPLSYNVGLTRTKRLVREALRGLVPGELIDQPKRGWFSPGAKWLRNPAVLAKVKTILSPGYHTASEKLFNWDELQKMLEEHRSGSQYHFTMLWAILTFQVWAKAYGIRI